MGEQGDKVVQKSATFYNKGTREVRSVSAEIDGRSWVKLHFTDAIFFGSIFCQFFDREGLA